MRYLLLAAVVFIVVFFGVMVYTGTVHERLLAKEKTLQNEGLSVVDGARWEFVRVACPLSMGTKSYDSLLDKLYKDVQDFKKDWRMQWAKSYNEVFGRRLEEDASDFHCLVDFSEGAMKVVFDGGFVKMYVPVSYNPQELGEALEETGGFHNLLGTATGLYILGYVKDLELDLSKVNGVLDCMLCFNPKKLAYQVILNDSWVQPAEWGATAVCITAEPGGYAQTLPIPTLTVNVNDNGVVITRKLVAFLGQ